MYIVSLTYKTPIEDIEKELLKHIKYLKKQHEAGHYLASRHKNPRTEGII